MNAGDVGLAFLDELPPAEVVTLLQERRQQLAQALTQARQTPPHTGSLQHIITHHTTHLQTELDWLDTLIAGLVNTTF